MIPTDSSPTAAPTAAVTAQKGFQQSAISADGSPSVLSALRHVISSPLLGIAPALSQVLAESISHRALIIFTEDCTGSPQKKSGDSSVIDHVTIAELDAVRESLATPDGSLLFAQRMIAGTEHCILAWGSDTSALLVLVDPVVVTASRTEDNALFALVAELWQLVALSIRQQVAVASPAYLVQSRAASEDRAQLLAELTADHGATLEQLLSMLRSSRVSDAEVRQAASDFASHALVKLRSLSDRDRFLREEPVAQAFERLKDDLRPVVKFGQFGVQFVDPPVGGRAIPGEVANGARAIVLSAVLGFVTESAVTKVRVQWDCDGHNLLVRIRDNGAGELSLADPSVRLLSDRAAALNGTLLVEATPDWGSEIAVSLPLDTASAVVTDTDRWNLSPREQQVLELLATGARNRGIASSLLITENTVKFHVANILRKVGATNRAELASLLR